MPLVHDRVTVRELTSRNHLIQLLACTDAFGFVPAVRFARRHIGFANHQTERLAIVTYGRIHVTDRRVADFAQHRGTEHRFGAHGGIEFAGHIRGHFVADHIVGPQTHHRGRSALLGYDVLPIAVLQNQQQIRKTQVCDYLPVSHQMMQPFAIFVIEIRSSRQNM